LVANSVVRVDPRTNQIVQVTRVGRRPDALAVGAGAVWVVNWRDRTISRIDATGAVETIGGVPRADHLVVDGDNLWVSSFDRSSVARINARTGEVVESLGVPSEHAEGLAVGGGYLWITNPATERGQGIETVSRVELRSGKVVSTIRVGTTPIFDAFGYGALWVANYDDDTVSVVSRDDLDGRRQVRAARDRYRIRRRLGGVLLEGAADARRRAHTADRRPHPDRCRAARRRRRRRRRLGDEPRQPHGDAYRPALERGRRHDSPTGAAQSLRRRRARREGLDIGSAVLACAMHVSAPL
jgi:DNA-binding beta-propeller fold protein YncE